MADQLRSAPGRERRGPRVSSLVWLIVVALLIVGAVNAVRIMRPLQLSSATETQVHVFPQGHPPVLTSYDLVKEDLLTFSLQQPFYTPADIDSLCEGDILHVTAAGQGVWRQVPDSSQPVFQRAFRVTPTGPVAVLNRDGGQADIPAGRINAPKDLPAGYRSKEYPHQTATMGSLIAAVGRVQYDNDGIAKMLDDHFSVGVERWLRVDGKPSKETQLAFALNLRWKEVAWQYNEGLYRIRVQLYRLRKPS